MTRDSLRKADVADETEVKDEIVMAGSCLFLVSKLRTCR